MHCLIYSDDPAATRAFFKDVLGRGFVGTGPAGDPQDWLIFHTGPSEVGIHPTNGEHEGQTFSAPRHHQVALLCEDLEATIAELTGRGARFTDPVDHGWGIGAEVDVPGADPILVYQPRHPIAHTL